MTQINTDSSSQADDTRRALLQLGVAAFLFSLMPVSIDFAGSSRFPLTVGAGIVVGFTIATHMTRYSDANHPPIAYRQILERCRSKQVASVAIVFYFLILVVNAFSYVFFSWSTTYIDTAVSASLYELWPVVWVLAFRFVDGARHGTSGYRIVPISTIFLMILSAGAIALVIYSTATPETLGQGLALPLLGLVLGGLSPIIGALAAFNFLLADRILYGRSRSPHNVWHIARSSESDKRQLEESIVHTCMALSRVCAVPIVLLLAVLETDVRSAVFSNHFLGGLFCGLVLNGPASFLVRKAHITSLRREIISLQYLSPVAALGFLAAFTEIDVARIDFLIFGTVSIVALNMLINSDPERKKGLESLDAAEVGVVQERYSLKALVVSLLGLGMLIYFRDELLTGEDLQWRDDGSYWAVLALASTIFALLLAFRLTRVESLLLAEDYRTLGIVRRVEMLPSQIFAAEGTSDTRRALIGWIRGLNRANTLHEYREAYDEANRFFERTMIRLSDEDLHISYDEKLELGLIRTELDALAHGRQQAREFAERIALWLIGIVIVVMCLAVPSESSGWPRLLSETFVIMLSSIVVYLLFHLADMRRSRADELLRYKGMNQKNGLPEGLYVRFRDEKDARWQRIFAGVIIFGVVSTVVGLVAWARLVPA